MEKIYETRRMALKDMIENMGRGAIAKVAIAIDVDPNYLSRCLYPYGKPGKKNIGDELVIKLNETFPMWSREWKSDFVDSTARRIEESAPNPALTVAFKTERDRQIEELVAIARTMSDKGLLLLTGSAMEMAKQHPAEAKQTLSSSQ